MKTKKSSKANLEKKRQFFFQIGLITALALALVAFEWRTFQSTYTIEKELSEMPPEEIIIPITIEKKDPPPPPLSGNEFEIKKEITEPVEKKVEQPPNYNFDSLVTAMNFPDEKIPDEPPIEPVRVPEVNPSFPGGATEMKKWIVKHIKYPEMAKTVGIEGTVHVSFVVQKNGKLTNVKVLHGIGGGCDQEAVKVIKEMPRWIPGRQYNQAVPVILSLPVNFDLH